MLGQTYYHQTIRKYVVLFGTLFNDISLEKRNSSGQIVSKKKIPIAYGPKQKFIARTGQDPNLDKSVAIQLPRMGFEMTSLTYDGTRKLNSLGKLHQRGYSDSGNPVIKSMYNPVPYIFTFSLFILVDNAEDGTQILEQILPFFTPEFTTSINVLTEMGIKLDVPLIINSVSSEDVYDGDFATRRTLVWTLDFTMKGFIYPEVKSSDKIIKSIDVSFRNMSENTTSETTVDRLITEDSTPFIITPIYLEDDTNLFVLETSDTNLSKKNIISNIKINPIDGANTINNFGDDVSVNTTITIFNPSVDYNEFTGEYE